LAIRLLNAERAVIKCNAPMSLAAKHIYKSSIEAERAAIFTKETRDSVKRKYRGFIYSQLGRWTSNETQIAR